MMDDRHRLRIGPGVVLGLHPAARIGSRLLVGALGDRKALHAHGKPGVVHHGEHVGKAAAFLADAPSHSAAIVAGKTTGQLAKLLGEAVPIVRAMPNTPAAIGKGVTALYASSSVTDEQRRICADLMRAVGESTPELFPRLASLAKLEHIDVAVQRPATEEAESMSAPVFSFGGHDGNPSIQKALGPLFEKHRFSVVFTGHSHGYERFKPIRIDLTSGAPKAVVDEKQGVVYVVTASGSARGNLYDIRPSPLHASAKKAPNFVVVRVSGDVVRAETIEPGRRAPIDTFEVKSRR